ncbi:uncharacterized protein M421DRAFT_74500 [Didymella exigua CBS 183.55]|uniref:Heterokaryon incompatibility domain-containing protein n=1 Tax=Didymella exigua CBS 183.55 TaxID=1150837 RepID=A0A6A5RDH8_9PLEO|nr:uncharacterized protein M421DRAFT_74500 [Didymella exigua CBS 183.55]KAF1923767.1 hypothetical protein M421DRAFT_74500 [Didymella exigua CBS 183.55]
MVSGVPVFIKENLGDALRYFRKHYPSTLLWVDALCISQADLDERASQVGLMVCIYRLADGIFAWLGKPRDEDKVRAGMALMRCLHNHVRENHKNKIINSKRPFWGQITGVIEYMHRTEGTDLWYAWKGIPEIFTCAYWTRLWIQQEATTPKPIQFWLGDHSLDDGPFCTVGDWLAVFSNDSRFPDNFRRACGYDDKVGPVLASRTT